MHGQSALEFITTYGFVFVVIAVVIALLFLFSSTPSVIIPNECTFYSGFDCVDSVFGFNSMSGHSTLYILATSEQPGIVNISSFNAVVSLQKSLGGSCTPNTVSDGQYVLCHANFSFVAVSTATYQGTFNISANYCYGPPYNVSNVTCAASSNYLYSGSLRLQPSSVNGITLPTPPPPPPAPGGLGSWTETLPYQLAYSGIAQLSCAVWGSYVYCLGGGNGGQFGINFGEIGSFAGAGGVSSWTEYDCGSFNPCSEYPSAEYATQAFLEGSCIASSGGGFYCIGGEWGFWNGAEINYAYGYVFNTPVSGNTIGPWGQYGSDYPIPILGDSCVPNNGFAYCVGGFYPNYGQTFNTVYSATISPSAGVGTWSQITSYPTLIYDQSCVTNAQESYIYCIGGYNGTAATNAVYYAPLNSGSVGPWSKTTSYPLQVYAQGCAEYNNDVYCVGGQTSSSATNAVYYAPLSGSGVGSWRQTTPYPFTDEYQSCFAYLSRLYCVGGEAGFGYAANTLYAPIT